MLKFYFSCLCLLLLLSVSCTPKVRSTITNRQASLNYNQPVKVLHFNDSVSVDGEQIGILKVGDTGMSTKCSYQLVLEKAKEEARKAGGNVIRITEHKSPDFMSSCHRIKADILLVNQENFDLLEMETDEADPSLDYAVLYIYRNMGTGALVNYNVHLGDSLICRVSNRFKQKIIIHKEGQTELWAKTESKVSLPVDIRHGRSYYIRCGVATGVVVGRPTLDLVSKQAGIKEFESVKIRQK